MYEGRRLPFANLQDLNEAMKTSGRRSPLRQFENPLHMEKDCMRLESKRRRDSAHFPLIAVTGYRSHAVRRVELIGYFDVSDTQYSLRISLLKQKRIKS